MPNHTPPNTRAIDILLAAQDAFLAMDTFRRDRERNKRFTYGDQWSEPITTPDGLTIPESRYLSAQGMAPLKSNLIRRLVRNVIGVFRSQQTEPTCIARDRDEQSLGETMSTVLQYNAQLNRLNELYARSLEEFLISGLIVHKKTFAWRNDRLDCWTDYVQPNNFFVDANTRDFRAWDIQLIGEIHDIPFDTLAQQFAHSPADHRRLSDIYSLAASPRSFTLAWDQFGYPQSRLSDFLTPRDQSLCRVIEVWRREARPRYRCHDTASGQIFKCDTDDLPALVTDENNRRLLQGRQAGIPDAEIPLIRTRWFIDTYWAFYYLSPFADILLSGETPYAHASHPYIFKAYPFIDSEIHSFVADIIDQQRYTNRLITLQDWIMRSSAKGVLLIPRDSLKGLSLEDYTRAWSRPNGVIVYEPSKSGQMPQQLAANSTNIGISELLNLQLKLFEDISGVNGALQGKPGYSGMSGTLYAQQTQNATTSLLDILDTFNDFITQAATVDVKNIQQFYDTPRIINIAGRSGLLRYDPRKMADVEFDLSIVPSTSTPAYRALANDFLIQIWQSGQISLQQLLEVGNFPFADALLQTLQAQQQQIQQGQTPDPIPPDLLAQARQTADPQALQQAQQFLESDNSQ